ncbi:MAG: ABC transporter permease subunit, partial [Victivallales bacterium]|nr:ABC transporter permease subunit [Victivallales bacterium]
MHLRKVRRAELPSGASPCLRAWRGARLVRRRILGVVLLEALHLFPILYLNVVAAFANVDPMLLEASADFGCIGFKRFWRIVLPLVMPGVFAGASLVFIWAFTELGTPLMFNYGRCTAVQIFSGL